jgi:stage IV sporulation protein FB
VLLLINLIPDYPLDGGRMLLTYMMAGGRTETATETYLRIGVIVGLLILLGGMLFDNVWVVAIGAAVLVLNLHESVQMRTTDAYDDSFMGYDFSQGYTSLERSSAEQSEPERRPGFLQGWKERRRAEKERRLAEQEAQVEQQLDAILDKIHREGRESLTDAERRLLERASARYRNKGTKE